MSTHKSILIKASIIAIVGNILLAIIKLSGGIISGSLAVVGDGLDTTGDVLSSIITLVAASIIMQPPNKSKPYGYAKADAIASNILSFVVIFAGLQLGIFSVSKFINNTTPETPSQFAIAVTIVSIIGKLTLTLILYKMGKRAKSSMLIANAKNMRGDIVISLTILIGLLFSVYLNLPFLDTLLAFIVSLWIIWVGIGIFKENNTELLDGVDDTEIYDKIFEAVKNVDGAFSPHRTRVRKHGPLYSVDLDIEVHGDTTVTHAHFISQCVENMIKTKVDNIYDIIVHIEPIGNDEDECYGVSEQLNA